MIKAAKPLITLNDKSRSNKILLVDDEPNVLAGSYPRFTVSVANMLIAGGILTALTHLGYWWKYRGLDRHAPDDQSSNAST